MSTKNKIITSVVVILIAYGTGYYTAPYKTITKTVTVEKKVTDSDTKKDDHKKVVIVDKKNKDGSEEKTTTITDNSETDNKTDQHVDISQDTTKETIKSGRTINLSLMGGTNVLAPISSLPIYGVSANTNILGPITGGLWVMSNSTAGVSLGINF